MWVEWYSRFYRTRNSKVHIVWSVSAHHILKRTYSHVSRACNSKIFTKLSSFGHNQEQTKSQPQIEGGLNLGWRSLHSMLKGPKSRNDFIHQTFKGLQCKLETWKCILFYFWVLVTLTHILFASLFGRGDHLIGCPSPIGVCVGGAWPLGGHLNSIGKTEAVVHIYSVNPRCLSGGKDFYRMKTHYVSF